MPKDLHRTCGESEVGGKVKTRAGLQICDESGQRVVWQDAERWERGVEGWYGTVPERKVD